MIFLKLGFTLRLGTLLALDSFETTGTGRS